MHVASVWHRPAATMSTTGVKCRLKLDAELRAQFQARITKPLPSSHSRIQLTGPAVRPATINKLARNTNDSAVLVPLFETDDRAHVILTHRSPLLANHRSEISLPGGRLEADETCEQAALRETVEEIGLNLDKVEIWGQLQPLVAKNMRDKVTPVVALLRHVDLDDFRIATDEVQTVFAAPLDELCSRHRYTMFRRDSTKYRLPVFFSSQYKIITTTVDLPKQYQIWGLTAAVLHMVLLNLLPKLYKSDIDIPLP